MLKKKQKHLYSIGKGNTPNKANQITDEETDHFYRVGSLGNHSPRSLLSTVCFNNCVDDEMRPGQEQRDLFCGDLELETNADGLRYVKFYIERQTKTRSGENPKNVRYTKPKMFEIPKHRERCPVTSYLAYKEKRPESMMRDDFPFYLATNTEVPKEEKGLY